MAINFARLESITKALKPRYQTGRAFHATFVFNKSKLICIANNDYSKLHPYHKFGEYKAVSNKDQYVAGIHSECAAIIKLGLEDCSHLTFVNVRINNHDQVAISKPCINCARLLSQIGYKHLWYYNGNAYVKAN